MQKNNEIVIFETEDHQVKLSVNVENETVWLSANQMAMLFERDEKTFASLDELKEQINLDKSNAKKYFR